MLKIISFQILFLLVVVIAQDKSNDKTITVKVEDPIGSKIYILKDVIEFIEENKVFLSEQKNPRESALMVLGLSGTGKSTLINYLNDIPLICLKKNGKWVLELESLNNTLPGGFKIGHLTKSETLYPSVYSPPNKNYSFIDNPGFKDTRGLSIEIANGFFREQITQKINHLKFFILIAHQDLNERGQQFRDSIKAFSDFLGIFDEKSIENIINLDLLAKSVGIIVSKVDNDGDTDEDLKEIFKEKLLNIIMEEKENKNINSNEERVFKTILENDQLELFSNPKTIGKISNLQSKKIHKLFDSLNYVKKEIVNIRVRIDQNYKIKLIEYLKYKNEELQSSFDDELNEKITELGIRSYVIENKTENAKYIYDLLIKVHTFGMQKLSFENFTNQIGQEILNKDKISYFSSKLQILDYFINLVPDIKEFLPFEKEWINSELNVKILGFTNNITDFMINEYRNLEEEIQGLLDNKIFSIISDQLNKAIKPSDLQMSENLIEYLRNYSLISTDFNNFLINLNEKILNQNEKDNLIKRMDQFVYFIQMKNIPAIKEWIGKKLSVKLIEIQNEFRSIFNEKDSSYDKINSVYLHKEHFANLSFILSKINENKEIKNLKMVKIVCTYSLLIDCDYKIDENLYSNHFPHLMIFSPKVVFEKNPTNIDLSTHFVPKDIPKQINQPNKIVNWWGSIRYIWNGRNGTDGIPGLPGYNGGNLMIISDYVVNYEYLNFTSFGGKGGNGQNGGDGENGKEGNDGNDDNCDRLSKVGTYYKCKMNNGPKYDKQSYYGSSGLISYDFIEKENYHGDIGQVGGNGGRGGAGGLPGFGGFAFIYQMSIQNIKLINQKMNNFGLGSNGLPGTPGSGGKYGRTYVREITTNYKYKGVHLITLGLSYAQDSYAPWEKLNSYYRDSYRRADDGYINQEINYHNIIQPNEYQESYLYDKINSDSFDLLNQKLKYLGSIYQNFNNQLLRKDFNNKIKNATNYETNLTDMLLNKLILNYMSFCVNRFSYKKNFPDKINSIIALQNDSIFLSFDDSKIGYLNAETMVHKTCHANGREKISKINQWLNLYNKNLASVSYDGTVGIWSIDLTNECLLDLIISNNNTFERFKYISLIQLQNDDLAVAFNDSNNESRIIIYSSSSLDIKNILLVNDSIIQSLYLLSNGDLVCLLDNQKIIIYDKNNFKIKYQSDDKIDFLLSLHDDLILISANATNKIIDINLFDNLDFSKLELKSFKSLNPFLNVVYENNLTLIFNFEFFKLKLERIYNNLNEKQNWDDCNIKWENDVSFIYNGKKNFLHENKNLIIK